MPRVTVAMATVRFDAHCLEAVRSVLRSDEVAVELVLVGDGVDEPLPEELSSDARVTYIHSPTRQGLAHSLNTILVSTDCDLVARLDADDICVPHRLALQAAYLEAHPEVTVVGSAASLIDGQGRTIGELGEALTPSEVRRRLPRSNPMIHPSVMLRRAEILDAGGYDTECTRMQDYELFLRLALQGKQMAVLGERLIGYRLHADQHSKSSPPRGPGFTTIQRRRRALAAAQGRPFWWRVGNHVTWSAGQWARHLGLRKPRYQSQVDRSGPRHRGAPR